jgi:hypothetical protein
MEVRTMIRKHIASSRRPQWSVVGLALVVAFLSLNAEECQIDIVVPPEPPPPPSPYATIEGAAFFPYESVYGEYPVYYTDGNELILVTLYSADDIYYEAPLRDYLTDTFGFYRFRNVYPGWYFLTAEALEYDPLAGVTYVYWAEIPDFYAYENGVEVWDLFLVWDRTEWGYPVGAKLFDEITLQKPGELEPTDTLNSYHKTRLDTLRKLRRTRTENLQNHGSVSR